MPVTTTTLSLTATKGKSLLTFISSSFLSVLFQLGALIAHLYIKYDYGDTCTFSILSCAKKLVNI